MGNADISADASYHKKKEKKKIMQSQICHRVQKIVSVSVPIYISYIYIYIYK